LIITANAPAIIVGHFTRGWVWTEPTESVSDAIWLLSRAQSTERLRYQTIRHPCAASRSHPARIVEFDQNAVAELYLKSLRWW